MYQDLYFKLSRKRKNWKNEEELRIGWISELSKELGIELHAERDRIDSSYNNVIIEFKAPGLFNRRTTSSAFKEAIYDRLRPYILKQAQSEGQESGDYIGIAIDGESICFAQIVDEDIIYSDLLPFSQESVSMVATALKDTQRRAIVVTNLIEDFGLNSDSGNRLIQSLLNALAKKITEIQSNKIKMLFEEWKTLFGQVADLTGQQMDLIHKKVNLRVPDSISTDLKIPATLFVLHTYNSLIIKLLAAEIVSTHGLTSRKTFAQYVATSQDKVLLSELKTQIEDGLLFDSAGIKGFIEEAIFSWYLDACSDDIKNDLLTALRDTLIKISFYRTDTLTVARTRDVLKGFYQALVPDYLRKSLGEFYTPDWLVQFTLDKINVLNWSQTRFLDPTCGSGSFLLEIVHRIRNEAETKKLSSEEILDIISNNIWGFDLNPLAVQTSRVNLLIAVADLLKTCPGKRIELPILMADAVYSPAKESENDSGEIHYLIGSQIANLEITLPTALVFDRQRLECIFSFMEEQIEKNTSFTDTIQRLERYQVISHDEAIKWSASLKKTYERILELHKKNWNGIWFRIVKNFFWSITAGVFDVIVGNPPWIRWSKLPNLYRERIKPTCLKYDIFSRTPHHGGNELDISGMITYTVADKWLKVGGQIALVLTQTLFQSPSSEGFRSFAINRETSLLPISIDDFKKTKPFPDAANKTVVALFHKKPGRPIFPVQYNVWKATGGQSSVIPPQLELSQVLSRLKSIPMEANPVTGGNSPWAILPPGRFKAMNTIAGSSNWVNGRKGVTADLNGVYFVKIVAESAQNRLVQIETRPEAGKKDIGPKQRFWIEPDFLYPLLKGASDFTTCHLSTKDDLYVIVPNFGITKEACERSEELLNTTVRQSKKYFANFESLLRQRSTWKRYLRNKPYYSIYNVGEYTFAPYKVIWAEQSSRFCSAVATSKNVPLLGTRPIVPDHKIFYVDFLEPKPAYYLCGLLNSDLVAEFVESHKISIQVGDIFKHMNLKEFNPSDNKHLELSKLVEEAHLCKPTSKMINEIINLANSLL